MTIQTHDVTLNFTFSEINTIANFYDTITEGLCLSNDDVLGLLEAIRDHVICCDLNYYYVEEEYSDTEDEEPEPLHEAYTITFNIVPDKRKED